MCSIESFGSYGVHHLSHQSSFDISEQHGLGEVQIFFSFKFIQNDELSQHKYEEIEIAICSEH